MTYGQTNPNDTREVTYSAQRSLSLTNRKPNANILVIHDQENIRQHFFAVIFPQYDAMSCVF